MVTWSCCRSFWTNLEQNEWQKIAKIDFIKKVPLRTLLSLDWGNFENLIDIMTRFKNKDAFMVLNLATKMIIMWQQLKLWILTDLLNTAGLNSNVRLDSKPNTILTIFILFTTSHATWVVYILSVTRNHMFGAVLRQTNSGKIK